MWLQASRTDCPVRARLATTPACPRTTSRRLCHGIPYRRVGGRSAVERTAVEFQAGAPVGVVSAEAHEQLQVTECPEAELVKARIPDALRATGVMFTSVAPRRLTRRRRPR
jgi:hypothetical protein